MHSYSHMDAMRHKGGSARQLGRGGCPCPAWGTAKAGQIRSSKCIKRKMLIEVPRRRRTDGIPDRGEQDKVGSMQT